MNRAGEFLSLPFKAAGGCLKIGGRITVGIVGVVFLVGGALAISPLNWMWLGIPALLIGLLLLWRAFF